MDIWLEEQLKEASEALNVMDMAIKGLIGLMQSVVRFQVASGGVIG